MNFTPKEKKQLKEWIAALYEERYPQGRGRLQSSEGYCCLGVGCIMFIPKEKQQTFNGMLSGEVPPNQQDSPMWLKYINNHFAEIAEHTLSSLNDQIPDHFTFPEIAFLLDSVFLLKVLS